MLFAELLAFVSAPKAFSMKHFDLYGKLEKKAGGDFFFVPLVLYSLVDGTLACLETPLRSRDKGRFDFLKAVASGKEEAAASGPDVFDLMAAKVVSVDAVS